MKKVAIVSCYFQKNYGSMLQAFATQKALNYLGYENETICIDGISKEIRNAKLKHYIFQLFDFSLIKGKIGFIKRIILQKINKEFKTNIKIRNKKFIKFRERFKISKQCNSRKELTAYCKEFSSILVGSDQLWLPSNIDADYYTLSFVPDEINKISYATSFGVSMIPQRQWGIANIFLNRINHVSVRENTGKEIVNKVSYRDVPVVCDPTLLFTSEQWAEDFPIERIIKEEYIFCYFLGNNPDQRAFVQKVKDLTGLKIVALLHLDEYIKIDCNFPDYAPFDVDPADFVNLIRNAEYVFTDSFHGTIFSVLHQKKFFTFKRFKEGSTLSTNSRMHSLFNILGLQNRFISSNENVEQCISKTINYKPVLNRIELLRKESMQFLINALEDSSK